MCTIFSRRLNRIEAQISLMQSIIICKSVFFSVPSAGNNEPDSIYCSNFKGDYNTLVRRKRLLCNDYCCRIQLKCIFTVRKQNKWKKDGCLRQIVMMLI